MPQEQGEPDAYVLCMVSVIFEVRKVLLLAFEYLQHTLHFISSVAHVCGSPLHFSPMPSLSLRKVSGQTAYYFLIVLIASFFTYFYHYNYPPKVFWDEPYHVASAQKYLNHVYFMEPHPPLGKLLIALGEKLTHANAVNSQFIGTDYAQNVPDSFSFAGYRLFPALLAWLAAPLLFCIFLLITRHSAGAALLSFLYIFDNALIVHNRGAMLDSTILFLMLSMVLEFLLLREWKQKSVRVAAVSMLFGLSFGLLMTTKLNGLVMILLVPAIIYCLQPHWSAILKFLALSGVGFCVAFCSIWYVHFALGTTINTSLPDGGYYQASEQYKKILTEHRTASLLAFPIMLRDSMKFVTHYNAGVPRLDLCKADENGSPFFFWPFGARTINYRWTQVNATTYEYLYLVPNPVVWLCGLIGVLGAFCLLISSAFFSLKKPIVEPFLLVTFSALYIGYMVGISQLTRVMYLYHYFPALLLSFILFALVLMNLQTIGRIAIKDQQRLHILLGVSALIFVAFQVYRPFTYYQPISNSQVVHRAILPLWDLHCVNCESKSLLVVPAK